MTYKKSLKNLLTEAIELITTHGHTLNDAENWRKLIQPSIERIKLDNLESVDITNIFFVADMINKNRFEEIENEFVLTLDQALSYLRNPNYKGGIMPENGINRLYFYIDQTWGDLFLGSEQAAAMPHPNWKKFIKNYESVMFKPIIRH